MADGVEAIIGVKLAGAEEALAQLEAILEALDKIESRGGTGVAGAVGGASPGNAQGAFGRSGLAGDAGLQQGPPGGGVPAYVTFDALSGQFQRLAYDPAVDRYANLDTGAYLIQPAGLAPGASGSIGATGAGGIAAQARGMLPSLGVAAMAAEGTQVGLSALGHYTQAVVSGNPYYAERDVTAGIPLAWAAAGAALGTVIAPGIGTGVGAAVGYGLGYVQKTAAGPIVEQKIRRTELGEMWAASGGWRPWGEYISTQDAGAARDLVLAGTPLGQGYLSGLHRSQRRDGLKWEGRSADALSALGAVLYNPAVMDEMGIPDPNRTFGAGEFESMAGAAAEVLLEEDPLAVRRLAMGMGNSALASLASQRASVLAVEGRRQQQLQPVRSAGAMMMEAGFGAGGYASASDDIAGILRGQLQRSQSPGLRRAREAELLMLERETAGAMFDYGDRVSRARSALDIGSSSRAFEERLYGGDALTESSFAEVGQARGQAARRLEAQRRQALSRGIYAEGSAQDLAAQEEVGAAQFAAGLGHRLEAAGALSLQADQFSRGRQGWISARFTQEASSGPYEQQMTAATREKLELLREEIRVLREKMGEKMAIGRGTATAGQQAEWRGQEAALSAQIEAKGKDAAFLAVQAQELGYQERAQGLGAAGQVAQIRGLGGLGLTKMGLDQLEATESLRRAEQRTAEEAAAQYGYNSVQAVQARMKVNERTVQIEQMQLGLAVPAVGAETRISESNAQLAVGISRMGYGGGQGVQREALRGLIDVRSGRVSDMEQNRANLRKEGRWTPGMEAEYVEQRNSLVGQMASLQQEYDEGWEGRLISEAFNMNSSGRLFLAGYSRLESTRSGVSHRAMGGTREQTEGYRRGPLRFLSMLGAGSAEGFGERAMAQAVTIELTPEASRVFRVAGNPLRENQAQVANTWIAGGVTGNAHGRIRPGA